MHSKQITITWLNGKVETHQVANASHIANIHKTIEATLPRGVCLAIVKSSSQATEASYGVVEHLQSPDVQCTVDFHGVLYKAPILFDISAQTFSDCSYTRHSCYVPPTINSVPQYFSKVFPWHLCFSEDNAEVALITETPPRLYIGDPYTQSSIPQWRNCHLTLPRLRRDIKGYEIAVHYLSWKYCMLSFEPLCVEATGSNKQEKRVCVQMWDTQTLELKDEKHIIHSSDCIDPAPLISQAGDCFFILFKSRCFAFSDITDECSPIWCAPTGNKKEALPSVCVFIKPQCLSLSAFRLPRASLFSSMSVFDAGVDVLARDHLDTNARCAICCLYENALRIYDVYTNTCISRIETVSGSIRSVTCTLNASRVLVMTSSGYTQLHYFDLKNNKTYSTDEDQSSCFPVLSTAALLSPCGKTALVTNGIHMLYFSLETESPDIFEAYSSRRSLMFARFGALPHPPSFKDRYQSWNEGQKLCIR